MTKGKPLFSQNNKIKQTHELQITPHIAAQYEEGPTAQTISVAHRAAGLNTPRANFRLARG
jgi:phosphoglycerate dehydrogenase-like enzyme